jgi:hypothetical protein
MKEIVMCTPYVSRGWLVVAFAIVVSLPQRIAAQITAEPENAPTRAAGAQAKGDYVLRTYEVSDLVINIQDHPYRESTDGPKNLGGGGVGGGGGGGFFSVPESDEGFGCNDAAIGRQPLRVQFAQYGGGGGIGGGRGGGMGGGAMTGVGAGELSPASTTITLNDLTRVLVNTVASDTWAMNGTGEGQVEPIGTALVVWQTPAVHEQIGQLLNQIRQGAGHRKTVTIDARWLLLTSDDLDRLVLPDQTGVPAVDRKALDEFTRRPGSIRGITNCFSSQLVYLVSGTRRNVVSSYIPVVGSLEHDAAAETLVSTRRQSLIRLVSDTTATNSGKESRVGYQPVVEKPNLGALLEIRPTLMRGDDSAIVDLKSTLTVAGSHPVQPDGVNDASSIAPSVDRIAIETQEFATTLRMPLKKPVLVGGLTYVPGSTEPNDVTAKAEGKPAESPQLYLVLEVR